MLIVPALFWLLLRFDPYLHLIEDNKLTIVSEIVKSLEYISEPELSSLREDLLKEFSLDDMCPLGFPLNMPKKDASFVSADDDYIPEVFDCQIKENPGLFMEFPSLLSANQLLELTVLFHLQNVYSAPSWKDKYAGQRNFQSFGVALVTVKSSAQFNEGKHNMADESKMETDIGNSSRKSGKVFSNKGAAAPKAEGAYQLNAGSRKRKQKSATLKIDETHTGSHITGSQKFKASWLASWLRRRKIIYNIVG
ncbi:unnamed protein product [Vicia faba]|uniref:Uncharacterized protein n=1 Tax=Vicia faba TaxID=3906 RepID=A0AAV1ABL5_VICFA|nr:unnamed protein product [Vicia faba]